MNCEEYEIKERLFEFVDLNEKCGVDIANTILDTMSESGIDFSNCRGQGYDNGNNVSGMEKATQADISGHISATLSQICGVYNNEADKRNFN